MAAKPLPSPEVLRQLLNYDPETGKLCWKERPLEMFASESHCKTWNTRYACKEAGRLKYDGYVIVRIFGHDYRGHRVAWAVHCGRWPHEGMDIDHVNLVRSDNRIANLREATRSQNKMNQPAHADSMSGLKGISRCLRDNKWKAHIQISGKRTFLGRFQTPEEAHEAYRRASEQVHGEFSRAS